MKKSEDKSNKKLTFSFSITSFDYLLTDLTKKIQEGKKLFLVTLNPEFIIAASSDDSFKKTIDSADLTIPDGIGLLWANQVWAKECFICRLSWGLAIGFQILFGRFQNQRLTGIDLMQALVKKAARKNWRIFLLGGYEKTADQTKKLLEEKYPGIKIESFPGPQQIEKATPSQIDDCLQKINSFSPQLLFVAFGMKKQEQFIFQNWPRLKVNLAMGIGGAFDYLSGQTHRAPLWLQNIGLEWLWRLFHQPWRYHRQLALGKFIWEVLKGNICFVSNPVKPPWSTVSLRSSDVTSGQKGKSPRLPFLGETPHRKLQ